MAEGTIDIQSSLSEAGVRLAFQLGQFGPELLDFCQLFDASIGPVRRQFSLAMLHATEEDADKLAILLVVTAGDTAGSSTANLMAPIIVNEANRTACQLILGGTWPVRAVLMPAA